MLSLKKSEGDMDNKISLITNEYYKEEDKEYTITENINKIIKKYNIILNQLKLININKTK